MPGKSIKIGPFKKGLNNISQSGECQDDEVVKLVNFEVALDSSLTCRPPIEVVKGSLLSTAYSSLYTVFGIYRVSTTEWYTVVSYQTGSAQWTVAAILNGDPSVPSNIITISTFTRSVDVPTCYAQWNDTCYFNTGANAGNVGFHWKKGDSGITLCGQTGYTMPHGNIMVSWKSRLWTIDTTTAANATTIYFSYIDANGSHPDQWRSQDNFPVDQGSGGFVTALLPLANSMLVFKTDSTYRFAYASSPASGQVDRLSDYIGASNQYSVVNFENYVYLVHQGRVYELINNLFIQINKLVYFQPDGDNQCVDAVAGTVAMSAVSRRIVIQYNNTMFVYGIDTKTWSQWRSYSGTPGKFFPLPQDPASANPLQYIAASQGTQQALSTNFITDMVSSAAQTYVQANLGANFTAVLDGTGKVTLTHNSGTSSDTATVYLNGSNSNTGFNVPLTDGAVYTLAYDLTVAAGTATPTVNCAVTYLNRNGSTSTVNTAMATGTGQSVTLTAPVGTIQAYAAITWTGAAVGDSIVLNNLAHKRASVASPITLLKLTDHHYSSASAVEYIECVLNTKSYDYQAPANIKRLFWWGIDCVTKRDINTVTVPIAQIQPPLWGDLGGYTWAQLNKGTWGNPLLWRGQQLNVIDSDSLANSMSANGRQFAKNLKSLRFRQIQFNITMTSLGNTATGPCKLFSLVTYALPHEKESGKVS